MCLRQDLSRDCARSRDDYHSLARSTRIASKVAVPTNRTYPGQTAWQAILPSNQMNDPARAFQAPPILLVRFHCRRVR